MKYQWFLIKNLQNYTKIQIKFWDLEGRFLYTRLNDHEGEVYMTGDIRKKCNISGNISHIPYGLVQVYYFIRNFWLYKLKDVVLIDNQGKQHHYKYKKYDLVEGKVKLTSQNWINNLDQISHISLLLLNGEWVNMTRTGTTYRDSVGKVYYVRDLLNFTKCSRCVTVIKNDGYYHTFNTGN